MKYILGLLCIVFPVASHAYEVVVTDVAEPYEVVNLSLPLYEPQAHLGTLENFPIMYEAVVDATTTLKLSLQEATHHAESPSGLSLMVVKVVEEGRGVTEIGRLNEEVTKWALVKDASLGMSFWQGSVFEKEITPGTYRIEVSTPNNLASYLLSIGDKGMDDSYFKTLGHIRAVQKHFGLSIFSMFRSSYVYYPLGSFLLFAALYATWRYRKQISHAA